MLRVTLRSLSNTLHTVGLAACLSVSVSACGIPTPNIGVKPYRMEIQQGNYISQEAVSQLKAGMSKDQVRFVLGTPLVTDIFHAERWDYIFYREYADGRREQRKMAVFFEDGKLVRVSGDVTPAGQAASAEGKPAEGKP